MQNSSMSYDYAPIVEPLIEWFEKEKRNLPWRSNSVEEGNPDAYHVWISEIMLQQTRVEAVKEYFRRFIAELPDIRALAEAEEDKLLKLWEGLGYYNRARNLQKAAKIIMAEYNGELPADYEALLSLPGIGSYTAGAIASQAYGLSEPAVDGNVLRVTKRLSGSYDDITKASVKKELEKNLKEVMPKEAQAGGYNRPGAFNQALMELGAIVCIPNGKPFCDKCPLKELCIACQKDIVMELPVKPSKKARKLEDKTVLIIEYQGKFAIHKRGNKGLLAKLWELPNLENKLSVSQMERLLEENGILEYEMGLLGEAKHIFSHIEWHMLGYKVKIDKIAEESPLLEGMNILTKKKNILENETEDFLWVKKEQIDKEYAIPSAFRAYKKYLQKD